MHHDTSPELIFRSLRTDRKIACIKLLRATVALLDDRVIGLRDAKDIIDNVAAGRATLTLYVYNANLRAVIASAFQAAGFCTRDTMPQDNHVFGR